MDRLRVVQLGKFYPPYRGGMETHLRLLAEGLRDRWSLDGLTGLVYAVPKIQAGLPPEARAGTPELKAAQRQFFVLLYRLLIGKDTGPRLPTLLLAVGEERLLHLIGAA